jgi:hypothetical protein
MRLKTTDAIKSASAWTDWCGLGTIAEFMQHSRHRDRVETELKTVQTFTFLPVGKIRAAAAR